MGQCVSFGGFSPLTVRVFLMSLFVVTLRRAPGREYSLRRRRIPSKPGKLVWLHASAPSSQCLNNSMPDGRHCVVHPLASVINPFFFVFFSFFPPVFLFIIPIPSISPGRTRGFTTRTLRVRRSRRYWKGIPNVPWALTSTRRLSYKTLIAHNPA